MGSPNSRNKMSKSFKSKRKLGNSSSRNYDRVNQSVDFIMQEKLNHTKMTDLREIKKQKRREAAQLRQSMNI